MKMIDGFNFSKSRPRLCLISALVLAWTILTSTTAYASGANLMSSQSEIELNIGEKGDAFAHRTSRVKVDRQPAGLNFYELRWSSRGKGEVSIRTGAKSIRIENVLSVTGVEDADLATEGMYEIRINSTLTDSDTIAHDEARLKIFALLESIRRAGGQTVIPRSMARIRGKDMTNFLLRTRKQTTLDPSYVPSFTEWMAHDSLTGWQFYVDRVFVKVQFMRERSLTDPTKPGAYLLSITLKSELEHFRNYVKPSDRKRWKEVLPVVLADMAKRRAKLEEEFRLQGVPIDQGYIDPPEPALGKD